METYEQRPISMYDNLNNTQSAAAGGDSAPVGAPKMHTSTPKRNTDNRKTPNSQRQLAAAGLGSGEADLAVEPTAANGSTPVPPQLQQQPHYASVSPHYADLAFEFDDVTKPVVHQQQAIAPCNPQTYVKQSQLPSTNNNVYYATLFKPTQTNTSAPQPQQPVAAKTTIPATFTTATSTTTNTLGTASTTGPRQQQRPLSQHSQLELNETSRQNIAAVKAALNDAKSKFFGLNGHAETDGWHAGNTPSQIEQIPPTKVQSHATIQSQPPAAAALNSFEKPQPKYQNIPTNSAIYRCHPPELPPKPLSSHRNSPLSQPAHTMPSTPESASPSRGASPATTHQHSPSPQSFNGTYQQLPLNDIDAVQPSQAVYMSTTVPQNIKASKIAGRHTPTRNSLRHSRMLVVNNKNYRGMLEFQHPNPMNFKYPNLARYLLILQIIAGLMLGCLAIWIFFLAPSTTIQENPYWSGLSLLFAGIIGLVLVRFQRIKRHKVREHCFLFLRADSYLLALLAVVLCCVAMICASIHHARLTASDTRCASTNPLLEQGSCTCTFNAPPTTSNVNSDDLRADRDDEEERELMDRSYKFEYRDLSCEEVSCEWTYMLVFSITLNTIGLAISVLYIVLLACYRTNTKRLYASVHTSTF